jgi:hypothetical protein
MSDATRSIVETAYEIALPRYLINMHDVVGEDASSDNIQESGELSAGSLFDERFLLTPADNLHLNSVITRVERPQALAQLDHEIPISTAPPAAENPREIIQEPNYQAGVDLVFENFISNDLYGSTNLELNDPEFDFGFDT